MSKKLQHTCPSSIAQPGAMLLGLVNAEGVVDILPQPLEVTEAFIQEARKNGDELEKRFRFSNRCLEHGCGQWKEGGCGVVQSLAAVNEKLDGTGNLPVCNIRINCRWYAQEGGKACKVCPFIVTNSMVSAEQVSKD